MTVVIGRRRDYFWFIGSVFLGAEPIIASIALGLLGAPGWLSASAILANVVLLVLGIKLSRSHFDRKAQVAADKAAKGRALEKEKQRVQKVE